MTPGPIVMVMSLIATTLPYQRETWLSSIVLITHPPSGTGRPGPPRLAPSSTRNMTPYRTPTLPGRGTGLTEVPPSHCLTPSSTVGGLTRPASRDASGLVAGPDRPPVTPIRMEARLQLRKK